MILNSQFYYCPDTFLDKLLILLHLQDRDRDTSRRSSRSSSRQRSRHSDKKPRKSERERRDGDIIELSSSDEDVKVIDGNEAEDQGMYSVFHRFMQAKFAYNLATLV